MKRRDFIKVIGGAAGQRKTKSMPRDSNVLASRLARQPTRKQFGNGSALACVCPKSWHAPRRAPTRLRDVEDSNDCGGQRAGASRERARLCVPKTSSVLIV